MRARASSWSFHEYKCFFPFIFVAFADLCQLDNIGISAGHLPNKPPFSNAYQGPAAKTQSTAKISNREVQSAIDDSDFFYDLYVRTTKSAIDMYAKAGRRKFALKLHGSLAALDV